MKQNITKGKTSRKVFALLLALTMVMTYMPALAFAETYEAEINTTKYKTLTEAVELAKDGDTIKLLTDVTAKEKDSGMIWFMGKTGSYTLDCNGYTLNGGVTDGFYGSANVTLKGFKSVETNYVKEDTGAMKQFAAVWAQQNAFVVEDGEFTATNAVTMQYGGTLELKKGTYIIKGEDCPVVSSRGGETNVRGGTYKGVEGLSKVCAISAVGNGTVNVYGGSFTGYFEEQENGKINIYGGTFSVDPSAYVNTDNYKVEKKGDVWTVKAKGNPIAKIGEEEYETLNEAVKEAKDGDVITIIADCDENVELNKQTIIKVDDGVNYDGNVTLASSAKKMRLFTAEELKDVSEMYEAFCGFVPKYVVAKYPDADVQSINCDEGKVKFADNIMETAYSFNAFNVTNGDMAIFNKLLGEPSFGSLGGGIDFRTISENYKKLTDAEQARVNEVLPWMIPYMTWIADFEVTFDKDVTAGSMGVGGYYGSYAKEESGGIGMDIDLPSDMSLGDKYRMLYDYAGFQVPYAGICLAVRTFNCGAYPITSYTQAGSVDGVTMTVKLNLYNGEEVITVGQYDYKFGYDAKINKKPYKTLADAIEEVKDGETIEMLRDVEGAHGISVPSGKNFTVDFKNHSYSVEKPGAGSSGTETQAFQLLKGSNITFKNGTISCTEENKTAGNDDSGKPVKMIIQNYANLTLDNMTIDGANINREGNKVRYLVSNNSGNVVIKDSTIIATDNDFAFDSCKYNSYQKPTVNVEGNSVIKGRIEASGGDINLKKYTTVKGQVRVGENKDGGAIGSVLNIKNGATVNGVIAVFGENTLNIEGAVNGYIATNGKGYNAGSVINIKEGAVINAEGDGVDVPVYIPNGTLNMTGGTVNGETAVYFKSTNLNISGGELNGTGDKKGYVYDGNGCHATGDALVIDSCNYPSGINSISISGGKFKSKNNEAVAEYKYGEAQYKLNFISGGHFSTEPKAEYIVETMKAVQDTEDMVKEGYSYTVNENQQVVILPYSRMTNGVDAVANLSGGGAYNVGDNVTLIASGMDNIEFIGWYSGEYNPEEPETNLLSKKAMYSLEARTDLKVYAIYKPNKANSTIEIGTTGAGASKGEVSIKDHIGTSETVDTGKKVTLEANVKEGESAYFICWQNQNGAVLSTESSFTTTVLKDTKVEALFLDEGAAIIKFADEGGKLISQNLYTETQAKQAADYTVVAASQRGRTFQGWTDPEDIGSILDESAVKTLIREAAEVAGQRAATGTGSALGEVKVTAKYGEVAKYSVTVKMVDVDGNSIGTPFVANDVEVGTTYKVSAVETSIKGLKLKGFSKDNPNNPIFTESSSFVFSPDVAGDYQFFAIYDNEGAENQVAYVSISEPFDGTAGKNKIGLTMTWSLPEGATLIEAGFHYGAGYEKLADGFINNKRKVLTELNGTAGSLTAYSLITEGNNTTKYCYRAFVTYKLGNDTITVVCSDPTGNIKPVVYSEETGTPYLETSFSRLNSESKFDIKYPNGN